MKKLIIFASFFLTACQSFFYYPDNNSIFYKPEQVDLTAEDLYFDGPDKVKLHAWLFRAPTKEKGLVIFFHGNAENLTSHFVTLSFLPAEGYSYLIFDYPGYGRSEGTVGTRESVLSGVAAIKWVMERFPEKPIFIFGGSLGGITALRSLEELGPQSQVRGLIIDASFHSYQSIAQHKLSLSWVTWWAQPLVYLLISDSWAPQKWATFDGLPKLVLHGGRDSVVEPIHGQRLFNLLPDPKQWVYLKEGSHGDSLWVADFKYRSIFLKFLDAHIKSPSWSVNQGK